jgi:hypothetical protein
VFNGASFTTNQLNAALDSALCEAAVSRDKHGTPKESPEGRPMFRKVKAIAEYPEVIERWGIWNRDLQAIAKAIKVAEDRPMLGKFDKAEERDSCGT